MKISLIHTSEQSIERITTAFRSTESFRLVWAARSALEATQFLESSEIPDLVLIDLKTPELRARNLFKKIIHDGGAILILADKISEEAPAIFDAMGQGAIDAVEIPYYRDSALHSSEFLKKIRTIAKLLGLDPKVKSAPPRLARNSAIEKPSPLLAIGSSTGGPKALLDLLTDIPSTFPYPIIIVQHVDEKFSTGLADWLDKQVPLTVKVAKPGDRLEKGVIMIAGTNDHLIMKKDLSLDYTPHPEDYPYRPSVNVLFDSLQKHWPNHDSIAVLLTGMGRDGANGLLNLRNSQWHTIAQDKGSSVIYGMPKAAAAIGAAKKVLPLNRIAFNILQTFGL